MKSMIQFCKKEAVLSIAVVLALLSVFFVRPDAGYLAYIDFRTLGILFCLMTIVAGLQQIGVFDRMAKGLLAHVAGVCGIVTILVLLCFFLSMLITNDVALITFVPLALIIMKQFSEADRKKWMLKCVVMQTVAANLGSMLTPIGNPQNLYLYGRAGMNISSFFRLMLPYSLISLALLLLWIWLPFLMQRESAEERQDNTESGKVWKPEETSGGWMATDTKALMAWGMLFGISLLAVGRILVWQIPFVWTDLETGDSAQGRLFAAWYVYGAVHFYRKSGENSGIQQLFTAGDAGAGSTDRGICEPGHEQCTGSDSALWFYGSVSGADYRNKFWRTWHTDCIHGKPDQL